MCVCGRAATGRVSFIAHVFSFNCNLPLARIGQAAIQLFDVCEVASSNEIR
jgi:hypothetical protein